MTTQNETRPLNETDRDELVDFSIRLGQTCWGVYSRSKIGFVRVFMLPSDAVRLRANELFQLGFSARMLFYLPLGIPELDAISEKPMGERAWKDYLAMHEGKIILNGPSYPNTPKVVLKYAEEFFLAGFSAGTLAVREILNS